MKPEIAAAVELQNRLRGRVVVFGEPASPFPIPRRLVAVDVGYDRARNSCAAALVLWDARAKRPIDIKTNLQPSTFPYVPGLLTFRELPPLLPLFEGLGEKPELVLCDGQGIAHPRRIGLASHLGVVLDCPSLGWAKSRLIGEFIEPESEAGAATPLTDPKAGGEQIGWVFRSRASCRPTFVSPGHRMSLRQSLEIARALMGKHRLCEPARAAHAATRALLKGGPEGLSRA